MLLIFYNTELEVTEAYENDGTELYGQEIDLDYAQEVFDRYIALDPRFNERDGHVFI